MFLKRRSVANFENLSTSCTSRMKHVGNRSCGFASDKALRLAEEPVHNGAKVHHHWTGKFQPATARVLDAPNKASIVVMCVDSGCPARCPDPVIIVTGMSSFGGRSAWQALEVISIVRHASHGSARPACLFYPKLPALNSQSQGEDTRLDIVL